MAFYFALFNVSNVNQELRGQRKAREKLAKERRRHSLATAGAHSAKDYRLLPKPRILLHDPENDTLTTSLDDTTTDESPSSHSHQTGGRMSASSVYRRGSSPEADWHRRTHARGHAEQLAAVDRAFMNTTNLREIAGKHKKVQFNSPAAMSGKEKRNSFGHSEEVWVRRNSADPPKPTDRNDENPWVYSIDLKRQQEEQLTEDPMHPLFSPDHSQNGERRRSSSSTGTTPERERRTSASFSPEALLGPMETLGIAADDSPPSGPPPAVPSVWRRRPCAMGVSGLEWRPTTSHNNGLSDEERRLQEDLRRHVNTWPQTRRTRWRPTSLIRRHSGGGAGDLAAVFQRKARQPPSRSMTTPNSPADELPPPPPMTATTKIVRTAIVNPTVVAAASKKSRPLVITPTDRRAPATVGGLSALAAQLAVHPPSGSRLPFARLNDAAAAPSAQMIRSSVF